MFTHLRRLVRVAFGVVVAFSTVSIASAVCWFALSIRSLREENFEPCPRDLGVRPGLSHAFVDDAWPAFYGARAYAYHAYAGPGGVGLEMGAGRFGIAFTYPRCR